MASIVIAGDTSGSVTLQAPAVAGSTVLNLPSTSGTIQTSGAGYTTNGVAYATSTSALSTGSALTFDGSTTFLLNASAASSQANFRVQTDTTGAVANGYFNINGTDYFRIYTTSSETGLRNLQNTPIYFSVNNTEQMRLTSTGLGIGTSSPAVRLQVAGATRVGSASGSSFSGSLTTGGLDVMVGTGAGTAGAFQVWDDNSLTTPRFMVTRDGNLGLGVTPSAWSSTFKALEVGYVGNNLVGFGGSDVAVTSGCYYAGGGSSGWKYSGTNSLGAGFFEAYNGTFLWYQKAPTAHTAGDAISFTQAMTLDASGNLLVGATATIGTTAGLLVASSGANVQTITTNSTSSSAYYIGRFYSGGTEKGYIYYNGSTVAFTSTSDYRLKENVQPMIGALEKVAQLKPCTYTWKENGEAGQGFIAHELAEVVPDCVSGEKDAVDEEGTPRYQGIDTSFLVATLTAALQEAHELIKSLETRISALETK